MTQIPVKDIDRPKPWRFSGDEETFGESSPNVSDGLQTYEDSPVVVRPAVGRSGIRDEGLDKEELQQPQPKTASYEGVKRSKKSEIVPKKINAAPNQYEDHNQNIYLLNSLIDSSGNFLSADRIVREVFQSELTGDFASQNEDHVLLKAPTICPAKRKSFPSPICLKVNKSRGVGSLTTQHSVLSSLSSSSLLPQSKCFSCSRKCLVSEDQLVCCNSCKKAQTKLYQAAAKLKQGWKLSDRGGRGKVGRNGENLGLGDNSNAIDKQPLLSDWSSSKFSQSDKSPPVLSNTTISPPRSSPEFKNSSNSPLLVLNQDCSMESKNTKAKEVEKRDKIVESLMISTKTSQKIGKSVMLQDPTSKSTTLSRPITPIIVPQKNMTVTSVTSGHSKSDEAKMKHSDAKFCKSVTDSTSVVNQLVQEIINDDSSNKSIFPYPSSLKPHSTDSENLLAQPNETPTRSKVEGVQTRCSMFSSNQSSSGCKVQCRDVNNSVYKLEDTETFKQFEKLSATQKYKIVKHAGKINLSCPALPGQTAADTLPVSTFGLSNNNISNNPDSDQPDQVTPTLSSGTYTPFTKPSSSLAPPRSLPAPAFLQVSRRRRSNSKRECFSCGQLLLLFGQAVCCDSCVAAQEQLFRLKRRKTYSGKE